MEAQTRMHDWMRHRCRIPGLKWRLNFLAFLPAGWQYEFVPEHVLPEGITLPGDPDMDFATNDWNRLLLDWQHEAVLELPPGTNGYLCYRFPGGTWRIQVRALYQREEFCRIFRVRLSQQPTDYAFVDENGQEVLLTIVKERIVVDDDRYAMYELL